MLALLTITRVIGTDRLFNLRWNRPDAAATPLFTGQAMMVDGMLIGDYQGAIVGANG
jgi:hypothetical protein